MRFVAPLAVLAVLLSFATRVSAKDEDAKSKIAWATSVEEALKEAKARNVPIFVDFGNAG